MFRHSADHHAPRLPSHHSALTPALDHEHSRPFVGIGSPRQTAHRGKVRKDFAEEMRMRGWNESRTADDLTVVDRQDVSSDLVVELIPLEPVRALELLPIPLSHVDFVA